MNGPPATSQQVDPRWAEEDAFRKWYFAWAQALGTNPNPDDPRHLYDYRAAYRAGARPEWDFESRELHWPSEHKDPSHPTYGKQDNLDLLRRFQQQMLQGRESRFPSFEEMLNAAKAQRQQQER